MRRLLVLVGLAGLLAGCGDSSPGGDEREPRPRATVAYPEVGEARIVPTPTATASPRAVRAFQARMTRICEKARRDVERRGPELLSDVDQTGRSRAEIQLEVQARLATIGRPLLRALRTQAKPPPEEREAFEAYMDTTEVVAEITARGAERLLRGGSRPEDVEALRKDIAGIAREKASADAWFDRIGVPACGET